MATRNLSRTIVEGDKCNWHKFSRKKDTRRRRAVARRITRAIAQNPDEADSALFPDTKEELGDAFDDNLNPLRRFLASCTGRKWDDVYSLLCRRYNRRTTKGWHLVDDHAVWFVTFSETTKEFGFPLRDGDLYVDREGILREFGMS